MENNNTLQKENVVAGVFGALLFSLVGGILWFVLYQVGFIAGISGLAGVFCAIKGYTIFAKKESIKGIVIAVVAAIIMIVIAWYVCMAKDVYDLFQDLYASGDVYYTITFGEALSRSIPFLSEVDVLSDYIVDLLIGLGLCIFVAASYVKSAASRIKNAENPAEDFTVAPAAVAEETVAAEEAAPAPAEETAE
ncbi:MAG: hypothetical protein IKL44_02050 [Clostridia bacterium]|nr:hypothetical protein [Clostridia bacterium]